jgi:hypothetical protein
METLSVFSSRPLEKIFDYYYYDYSYGTVLVGGWGSHVLDLANQIPACAKIHRLVLTVITCFETVTGRH